MQTVIIGIGSNLDNPQAQCVRALDYLCEGTECFIISTSSWYLTEPFGYASQPWFINGAVELKTNISPLDLLYRCKAIEHKMGRVQTVKWGPRIIDLDILLWERCVFRSKILKIPHPLMHLRRFVLHPICDLNPEITHPLLGITMRELLENLEDRSSIFAIHEESGSLGL